MSRSKNKNNLFKPEFCVCEACGLKQFRLTAKYDPDSDAHPGMLEMVEPYKSWGWTQLPQDDSAGYGVLECGGCGAALAPSGKLSVI